MGEQQGNTTLAPAWLDLRGASARALVSESLLMRAARRGDVRAYKIGLGGGTRWRFRAEDIDQWVTRSADPQPFNLATRRTA